jgi:type II secretory pathway pseudopilin PulG
MKMNLKKGMTLVEVIVAAFIFMIFCAGFYAVFIGALRTHKLAGDNYRATLIARNRIQRALSFDYGSLSLMAEPSGVAIDGEGNLKQNGLYRRPTTINTNVAPNLTQIQVEVYYPHRGTNLSAQPVKVTTLISNKF